MNLIKPAPYTRTTLAQVKPGQGFWLSNDQTIKPLRYLDGEPDPKQDHYCVTRQGKPGNQAIKYSYSGNTEAWIETPPPKAVRFGEMAFGSTFLGKNKKSVLLKCAGRAVVIAGCSVGRIVDIDSNEECILVEPVSTDWRLI